MCSISAALALAVLLAEPAPVVAQASPVADRASVSGFDSAVAADDRSSNVVVAEAADLTAAPPACPSLPSVPSSAPCNCAACQKKAAELKKAISTAYAPVFYNNNFSYVNNPTYTD